MGSATAAERAQRLLAILHLLEPDTELSLASMAAALGTSPSELAADLEVLSCCGLAPYTPDALIPVIVDGSVALVWGKLPALDRPVRLSRGEAHAIMAALQASGISASDSIFEKLASVTAAEDADAEDFARILTSAAAEGGQDALKELSLALQEHRLVRLWYQSADEDRPRERFVEPLALLNERGHWYLEAFARDVGALRTFRLDRMHDVAVLDERVALREISPSGSAFVGAGLPLARIRLAPSEEPSTREWPGMRLVSENAEGALIDVPYSGTAWIARQVASRLGSAEALEPPEVREAVRDLAQKTAALY